MTWRVVIRPNAEADLREAWLWYESLHPGLGDDLLLEVRAAISRLEIDPERHPFYYRNFRRLLTRRFPYKLFYRVESDHVVIFRLLHARREHRRQL